MSSRNQPLLEHVSGDTFRRAWILSDASNALVNLTGASAVFRLVNAKTLALSFEVSLASPKLVLTALAGRIDYQDDIAVAAGEYLFRLKLTHAGVTTTIEQGQLTVLPGI